MDTASVVKYGAAVVGALGGPAVLSRLVQSAVGGPEERLRSRLAENVKLLKKLPKDAQTRELLVEVIDEDVRTLCTEARTARRDWTSIMLGLVFILGGAMTVWGTLRVPGWWHLPSWLLAFTLFLFGGVGVSVGLPKTQRDQKNNPVQSPPEAEESEV